MAESAQTQRFSQRSTKISVTALPYEIHSEMLGSPIVAKSQGRVQQAGLKKA